MTLQEKFDKIALIFNATHNIASTDYIASKLGVESAEAEKLLKSMEREGRVTFNAAKEVWRWSP